MPTALLTHQLPTVARRKPAAKATRLPATLTIGVVGAGRNGLGLGSLWAAHGHKVLIGHCKGSALLTPVLAAAYEEMEGVAPQALAAASDVILLGASLKHLPGYLSKLGALSGKIVIDPYPLDSRTEDGTLVGELIRRALPEAHVVKAFSTVHWTFEPVSDFRSPWEREELEFSGGNAQAKAVLDRLITDLGLVARDLGSLDTAREIRGIVHLPAYAA